MTESRIFTSIFDSLKSMNPSSEHLVGMLIEYRSSISLLRVRFAADAEKLVLLDLCERKMDEAQRALTGTKWSHRKRIFVAWDLFHQVSADLVLFMGPAELAAYGRKLIIDLKTSSLPDTARTDWIIQLEEILKKLGVEIPAEPVCEQARQLLRTVICAINSQVDNLFWDIWTKKFIGFIYSLLLFVLLLIFLDEYKNVAGFDVTCIGNVALLGAMGGLLSGIFTGEPLYIAKGHFWFTTFYHALVRPVQGALAAMLMFWMIQSQYLIMINPPLDCNTKVFSCGANCPPPNCRLPVPCVESVKKEPAAVTNTPGQDDEKKSAPPIDTKSSLIVLNAAEGKQVFLYLVALLMAGFSGDKLLKSVSDKVTSRLFADAEKTKEAK